MAQETTKIEDYAFLSDTQTGALVSRDGCVDWLCFPRFDSPACFASLLGEKENGHWRFFPDEEVTAVRRRYRGETLILETEMETKEWRGAPDRFHAAARRESGHHPHHRRLARQSLDADGTDHPLRLRAHRAVGAAA